MKSRIPLYVIPFIIFSCNEDPVEEQSISYRWVPSEFSKKGANFHLFRTGDDNRLYALGFLDGKYGVHKAANGWQTVIELSFEPGEPVLQDFAVFKKNIYLNKWATNIGTLWKTNGTNIDQVTLDNFTTSISYVDSKLVVTGDFRDRSNNSYGVAYSTDGSTFIPVAVSSNEDFVTPGHIHFNASNKIFLGSRDGFSYVYDGSKLEKLEYPQYQAFNAVNARGEFYNISSAYSGNVQQYWLEKFANGTATQLIPGQ